MHRTLLPFAAASALAIFCLPGEPVAAPAARRPNILFLMPDQMRAQAMGCMGNPDVRTPNIDRLAAGGILFQNTFANTPVCCPARAILQTGLYVNKNGMVANDLRLRESHVGIAELLAQAGYRTGFIGKWHLDGGPRNPGFVPPGPRRQGYQFWAASECSHAHFRQTYFRDTPEPIQAKAFEPEEWTNVALEFLRQKSEQPFFLMVQMGPPHDPYGAPEPYAKQYDPAKLTMRPNWVEGVRNGSRKDIAAYYAAITAIDDQVGRLMQALKESGQEENTIVFLTSDHGDMLGSQGKFLKRKPWEESIRVPGILRYPARVKAGQVSDALISHVDLPPTFLSLCGVKPPAIMQGADLSGLVLGTTRKGPDSVFFQIFVPYAGDGTEFPWRGVRTDRYVYARSEKEPWVLYDLKSDPYEMKNLAADPAAAKVRAQLEARLAKWMKYAGDSWSNDSMELVEDKGRLYRFETFYTLQEYFAWAKQHPDKAPKD